MKYSTKTRLLTMNSEICFVFSVFFLEKGGSADQPNLLGGCLAEWILILIVGRNSPDRRMAVFYVTSTPTVMSEALLYNPSFPT